MTPALEVASHEMAHAFYAYKKGARFSTIKRVEGGYEHHSDLLDHLVYTEDTHLSVVLPIVAGFAAGAMGEHVMEMVSKGVPPGRVVPGLAALWDSKRWFTETARADRDEYALFVENGFSASMVAQELLSYAEAMAAAYKRIGVERMTGVGEHLLRLRPGQQVKFHLAGMVVGKPQLRLH